MIRALREERGSVALETTLMLTVLVPILFAILQFGDTYHRWLAQDAVAIHAARLAAERGGDAPEVRALVADGLRSAGIDPSSATVLELGFTRLVAERARAAADLAVVIAVNDQDEATLARTGRLHLRADAAEVARSYLRLNLEPLRGALADDPDRIARAADVYVAAAAPATDPRTRVRYLHPSVRVSVTVPVRTPVLGALLGQPVTAIEVRAAGSAR